MLVLFYPGYIYLLPKQNVKCALAKVHRGHVAGE